MTLKADILTLSETHINFNLYIETEKMVLVVESLCMNQTKFNLIAEKIQRKVFESKYT